MRKGLAVWIGSLAVVAVSFAPLPALAQRECPESLYFGRAGVGHGSELKAMSAEPAEMPVPPTKNDAPANGAAAGAMDQFSDDPLPGEEAYRKEYRPSLLREKERMAAVAAGQKAEDEPSDGQSAGRKNPRESAGEAFGMRERQ